MEAGGTEYRVTGTHGARRAGNSVYFYSRLTRNVPLLTRLLGTECPGLVLALLDGETGPVVVGPPLQRRPSGPPEEPGDQARMAGRLVGGIDPRTEAPAGLTGVWAEENTRASIWACRWMSHS